MEDKDGYAVLDKAYTEEPIVLDQDYLRVKVRYFNDLESKLQIELPFSRLYMGEDKAQIAEDIYREATRNTKDKTYASVHIKDGKAVLEDVYVNGTPILKLTEERLNEEQQKEQN